MKSRKNMIENPLIFKTKQGIPKGTSCIDIFPDAVKELFFIENPHTRKNDPATKEKLKAFVGNTKLKRIWIYYPWLRLVMGMPEEDIYFQLRTARNRNLITPEEQKNYRKCVVGIAGLSVGSSVLSVLVMCGGPKTIKIADPDTVDITNLNRIRAKLYDVGKNKADIAAREVWELDPFTNIHAYREGLQKNNINAFMAGKPRLDIFIDEMDNINLKIKSRLICRDLGIPVLMATDNGDGVIVDVERFDLERKRPIFHGQVTPEEYNQPDISGPKSIIMAIKIIDPAFFTERQQDSILHIGKTLSGVAQIGTAATIAGSALAFAVRQIANKKKLPSGRYTIRCEDVFIDGYNSLQQKKQRTILTKKFTEAFEL